MRRFKSCRCRFVIFDKKNFLVCGEGKDRREERRDGMGCLECEGMGVGEMIGQGVELGFTYDVGWFTPYVRGETLIMRTVFGYEFSQNFRLLNWGYINDSATVVEGSVPLV